LTKIRIINSDLLTPTGIKNNKSSNDKYINDDINDNWSSTNCNRSEMIK